MKCNALCGDPSIPFHCFVQSGAELELGRERQGGGGQGAGLLSEVDEDVHFH